MDFDHTLSERFQELADKQEIHEAVLRYCRGVDRCEPDLIRSAFHPDAFDDHGAFRMPALEFADAITKQKREKMEFSVHRITNHLIEIDGDTAISEAIVSSVQRVRGETFTQFSGSRYLDRFEKRDGEWRIAYRLIVHDWDGSAELGEWRMADIPADTFTMGGRGSEDPIINRTRLFPPISPS